MRSSPSGHRDFCRSVWHRLWLALSAIALCSAGATHANNLPYPDKNGYRLKGIGYSNGLGTDIDQLAATNTGSIVFTIAWASAEKVRKGPPCSSAEQQYDGHCFYNNPNLDAKIKRATERGLAVTAVLYGVPDWARIKTRCSPAQPGFDIFCAPQNPADFGRFAGYLAKRYNGQNGHGRIVDFVVHHQANDNAWFDTGCGQGLACDIDQWIATYAANFNAA